MSIDTADITWPVYKKHRRKIIRHSWDKITNSGKLQHSNCPKCKCEKYFDDRFGRLIFVDRFGKIRYRTPDCVLPFTVI